jgi:hypothetical protein
MKRPTVTGTLVVPTALFYSFSHPPILTSVIAGHRSENCSAVASHFVVRWKLYPLGRRDVAFPQRSCRPWPLAIQGLPGLHPAGHIRSWSGVEWSGVEWSGVEWSGVVWTNNMHVIGHDQYQRLH